MSRDVAGAVPDTSYPESHVQESLNQQDAGVSGDTGGIVDCLGILAELMSSPLGPSSSSEHPLSPNSWEATGQCTDLCRDPLLSQATKLGEGA